MVEKILTDRLEVEKMATDSFVYQNNNFGWIELTDILTFNRFGTYNLAFSLVYDMTPDWRELLIQEIKSLPIPTEKLRGCIVCLIVNEIGESLLTYTSLLDVLYFIREYTKNESNGEHEGLLNTLWNTQTDPSMPANTLRVNLIFTTEKTKEDKLEDEKHRDIMIENLKMRWSKD